jgi:hypothetical protein
MPANTTTIYPVPRDVAIARAYLIDGWSQQRVGHAFDGLSRQRVNAIVKRACRVVTRFSEENGDAYTCAAFGLNLDDLGAFRTKHRQFLRRQQERSRTKGGDVAA